MRSDRADLLVIGAGPAGLTAAAVAARFGAQVLVVDESPEPGGRLPLQLHQEQGADGKSHWRRGDLQAVRMADEAKAAGVRILNGASVWGLFPEVPGQAATNWHGYLTPVDPADNDRVVDRVEARAVLVATGAVQNPLALPGWTMSGVMLAGAATALVNVYRVAIGGPVVVVGIDPLAMTTAEHLTMAGVNVIGILPPAPGLVTIGAGTPAGHLQTLSRAAAYAPGAFLRMVGRLAQREGIAALASRLMPRSGVLMLGTRMLLRRAVTAIVGTESVTGVLVADIDAEGRVVPGTEEEWPARAVVTSAGLYPLVELLQAASVATVDIPELGGHVPVHGPGMETRTPGIFVAGSMTGVAGAGVAVAQGRVAGLSAARYLERLEPAAADRELESAQAELSAARAHGLPFMPDADRGLARLRELWAAR